MKKLRYNFALKTAAFLLSFITMAAAVISSVSVGFMVFLDFYSRPYDTLRTFIMEDYATHELYNAFWKYQNGGIEYYYRDKNVLYTVSEINGTVLATNFDGQDYICEISDTFSEIYYYTADGKNSYDYYEYVTDGNYYVDNEMVFEKETKLDVTIRIPEKMEFTDRFLLLNKAIEIGHSMRYRLIAIAAIGLISSIVILCFLFSAVGHKSGCNGITLNYLDRIPLDICAAAVVAAFVLAVLILDGAAYYSDLAIVVLISVFAVLGYFLVLGFLLTVATRIKTRTLIKNTVIFRVVKFLLSLLKRFYDAARYVIRGLPTVWKAAAILAVFLTVEFIAMLCFAYEMDNFVIFWIIRSLWLIGAVMLVAVGFYRLKKGSEQIAAGNLDAKIDTKYLFDDLKSFGESINSINDGLQYALDEKMRSERMKTELITNVSHDIKTPLTSIINYVDLIKKEENENEKVREYIDVLDRQSTRLKKLIEDLVEASKASTGNLSVELAQCDAAVLLTQAAGEYDERLSAGGLEVVLNVPQESVKILADGRRLWRVFDNLMNNICKYAQPATRVYLDLVSRGGIVQITFKNISRFPLNISGDELTERFVRGDRSRNTEGSGLGLSIAKNLVELQGGEMEIVIDGDLFKVVVSFKAQ